jgi:hypothetical protein
MMDLPGQLLSAFSANTPAHLLVGPVTASVDMIHSIKCINANLCCATESLFVYAVNAASPGTLTGGA